MIPVSIFYITLSSPPLSLPFSLPFSLSLILSLSLPICDVHLGQARIETLWDSFPEILTSRETFSEADTKNEPQSMSSTMAAPILLL